MGRTRTPVSSWFVKSKRAQSSSDDETWVEGGACPTLNAFDTGDTRATVVIYGITDDETFGENMLPTMQTPSSGGGGHPPAVAVFSAGNSANARSIAYTEDGTSPLRGSSSGTNQVPTLRNGSAVRRLTPVECERLQGFPDNWTASQSDSARYRQMGNAVTVNVAAYVGWLIDTTVRRST